MSYPTQPHDEITIDDDKRDMTQVHEEGLTQSKSWEQVKAEAERDEEWQHSLSLFQSLKINRAVSRPSQRWAPTGSDSSGGLVVDCGIRLYHHGVLRHTVARISVWPASFQRALW